MKKNIEKIDKYVIPLDNEKLIIINAALNRSEIKQMIIFYESGLSLRKIAEFFKRKNKDISYTTVHKICTRLSSDDFVDISQQALKRHTEKK